LLHEATCLAGRPPLTAEGRAIGEMTLAEPPARRRTGPSGMAKAAGVTTAACSGSGAHGLKRTGAHLQAVERPKFAAKVQDVVGLYVDPPEHAIVLSVDGRSRRSRRSTAPSPGCR